MSINFIPLGNAIDLVTSAVTDSITGTPITDATLTAVLKTEAGVTLATSSALTHTSGGVYKGTFDISGVSLTLNTHYYLSVAASNYALQWKRLYRAEDRPLQGAGSVSIDLTPGTSGLPTVTGIPVGDGVGGYSTALIVTYHKDGTQTPYPAANTDAARGTALKSAVTAATTSGDVIRIGPGTYELGTNNISLTANTSLIGSDRRNCTIKSNHASLCLQLHSSCTVQDFTLYGEKRDDVAQPATQFPIALAASSTGVVIRNLSVQGDSDGILIGSSGCTLDIYDCEVESFFDALAVNVTNCTVNAWNTLFYSTARANNPYGYNHAVTSSGTVNLHNCRCIVAAANADTECDGILTTDAAAVVNVYGGFISTANTGGATPYDLRQSTGTLKIAQGLAFTATKTSGTISRYATIAASDLSSYSAAQTITGSSTNYTLTNTTTDSVDFGAGDPTLTLATTGTYLIIGNIRFDGSSGFITGAPSSIVYGLRRTNNTAANLGKTLQYTIPQDIASQDGQQYNSFFESATIVQTAWHEIYAATAGDIVVIHAGYSGAPAGGTIVATSTQTSLTAIRLY